jgi:hypothetical protein
MKTATPPIKPRTVVSPTDTALTFADDGRVGLPPEEARAKIEAFRAKHPPRVIRKGHKGAAELVKEARESRDATIAARSVSRFRSTPRLSMRCTSRWPGRSTPRWPLSTRACAPPRALLVCRSSARRDAWSPCPAINEAFSDAASQAGGVGDVVDQSLHLRVLAGRWAERGDLAD